jgi:predicted DNA-binding transcriptional regulator YafY
MTTLAHLRAVRFIYKNHEGIIDGRTVIPQRWWFGISQYHHGEQWFMHAFCLDRKAYRDFAQADISEWENRPLPPGTKLPEGLR